MRVPKIIPHLARTSEQLQILAEDGQAALPKEGAALGRGGRVWQAT